jgi:hypothetical protein
VELQKERERLRAEDDALAAKAAAYATAKWEYHFVPVTGLEAEGFLKLLQGREARAGTGHVALKKDGKDPRCGHSAGRRAGTPGR